MKKLLLIASLALASLGAQAQTLGSTETLSNIRLAVSAPGTDIAICPVLVLDLTGDWNLANPKWIINGAYNCSNKTGHVVYGAGYLSSPTSVVLSLSLGPSKKLQCSLSLSSGVGTCQYGIDTAPVATVGITLQ
jgi:hypothetical protein